MARSTVVLVAALLVASEAAAQNASTLRFNRDIRPIMSGTCFRCHGPDKSSRMVNMRLDLREEATKARPSGTPIVPGDPDKSLIIQRIFATNARVMPPVSSGKELTQAQKETIRRWVAEGAQYEGHWAYQPVTRPDVPAIAGGTIVNPIDAFIQARLKAEGLQPSPEADRRTLLRRVTLDLTGLLPTAREMDAFLKDRSPDAYEKVVDRLLASPRYAEQQTMHWLDAVRYADTCGFHGDNPFPAWPYRDYVLRSYRDNKPFDEFTREQLAGDLMPDATVEQKVASAYNRLNRTSAEGGVQPAEYLAKYGADRVRTLSVVWLGSTLGCAECHDHKFDPFLTKDFYAMKSFFADVKETGLVPDKGDNAWGSQITIPDTAQSARLADLDRRIAETQDKLKASAAKASPERAEWESRLLARNDAGELGWQFQHPVTATANQAHLRIYNDEPAESNGRAVPGMIAAEGPNPDNETYTVTLQPGAGTWTALGVEIRKDENLPGTEVARGADRLVLTEVDAELSADGNGHYRKLPVTLATAMGPATDGFPAMAAIDNNPATGWAVAAYGFNYVFLSLRFPDAVTTEAASKIVVRLDQDSSYRRATIGRFRIALSNGDPIIPTPPRGNATDAVPDRFGGLNARLVTALRATAESRDAAQKEAIETFYTQGAPDLLPLQRDLALLDADRSMLQAEIPRVVVTEATEPRETRILPRGNWMDDSGAIVEPAIPEFLGKLDSGGRRANRLDLANWLVSANNPLTARAYVNRAWRQFFGTGISRTLEDLGSQGEWPTNPELLDWLATEFMQPTVDAAGTHPWDVKHLIRTIVSSHTYRQASTTTPLLEEKDPDNRLLARQSRFRVDAETVRDIAMQVSGLLVENFGGPSVRPYQPDGYLATLNFPKREYSASHGDDLYRRGVYTHWQRTFLHPSMVNFDAPTREECTLNRINSNTPLQALELLNDPIYVEAARVFAQHILTDGGRNFRQRIDWAFERAFGRAADADEIAVLSKLYDDSVGRYTTDKDAARALISTGEFPVNGRLDAPELAAMTTVARAILNLHETITRD